MSARGVSATLAVAASLLLPGAAAVAQTVGALDAGVSAVQYEGYLASGALFLSPTLQHDTPRLSLGLQGGWVLFESRNHILHGTVAGAWRTPPLGRWRAEISGSGGVSSYVVSDTSFPAYGHVLGRLRTHYGSGRIGGWASAATGHSFFGDTTATPVEIAVGGWAARERFAVGGTIRHTWIADSSYLDVTASLRWIYEWFELSGSGGFRTASQGAGSGAWAEAALQIPIWHPVAVLIGGGRYPSDPVRGVLGATYVSAGIRIIPFRTAPPVSPAIGAAYRRGLESHPPEREGAPRISLGGSHAEGRDILIEVDSATRVELAGDFTDWTPRALRQESDRRWRIRLPLAPGIYRVNVRVDGGRWTVPVGMTSVDDEFGGQVGLLVVP